MQPFFDVHNVAFVLFDYPVSYAELIGTIAGLISVYYAARSNILTWPVGLINELFLFIVFYQVHLYADMFLQAYFFFVTVFGWYNWRKTKNDFSVSLLSVRARVFVLCLIISGTIVAGFAFKHIHIYLPSYFAVPASYPYWDSLVMVSSITATVLLAKKKMENWYLWLGIDIVCVMLYYQKAVIFLSLEYLVFLILVFYGLYNWNKKINE